MTRPLSEKNNPKCAYLVPYPDKATCANPPTKPCHYRSIDGSLFCTTHTKMAARKAEAKKQRQREKRAAVEAETRATTRRLSRRLARLKKEKAANEAREARDFACVKCLASVREPEPAGERGLFTDPLVSNLFTLWMASFGKGQAILRAGALVVVVQEHAEVPEPTDRWGPGVIDTPDSRRGQPITCRYCPECALVVKDVLMELGFDFNQGAANGAE